VTAPTGGWSRRRLLAAGGAAALAARAGLRPAAAQTPGVLRIARGADSRSLDPHINARLYDRMVLYTLYEPLVDADAGGNFVPVLARAWEVGSTGLVVTFHLRAGVVFHDGTLSVLDLSKI